MALIRRLRAPDGCPWDRKQTRQDIGKYLLDESYETLDALTENDPGHIQEELGDADSAEADIQKYRKQMEGRRFPKEVCDKLEEEFARLLKGHPYSQEYGVIQNYIETVLSLPWDESTEDCLDIARAKKKGFWGELR